MQELQALLQCSSIQIKGQTPFSLVINAIKAFDFDQWKRIGLTSTAAEVVVRLNAQIKPKYIISLNFERLLLVKYCLLLI